MQHAVAYYRVSTASQGRSGLGIEAQRAAVARFAEAEGFILIAEFVEAETGKGADALDRRPQLAAALAAGKTEVSGHRRQARPALPRRGLHCRTHGAAGAVHCRRTGRRRRSVHAAPLRGSGREGAAADLGADAAALAARKAQGARLGNRSNAAEAARSGRKVQTAEADAFAANVLPIIESLRASGVRDLRGLAAALNNRGVRTARGGRWHVSNVKNLVDRLNHVNGLF